MLMLINGDSAIELKRFEDSSIDLMVTDPPYSISFMGLKWDRALPKIEIWKECLRVLKPGAFAFVACTPRADCFSRMVINLEDAGFNTAFTPIYWTYANGFPKAMNISKSTDKKLGHERKTVGKYKLPEHNTVWNLKQSNNKSIKGSGGTFTASKRRTLEITAPDSKESIILDGAYAGFQPKPAVEVIIVAMKPLSEKTYVEQALNNGKGITWLNRVKIPINLKVDDKRLGGNGSFKTNNTAKNVYSGGYAGNIIETSPDGRFPANLLISDDILDDGNNHKSGEMNCIRKNDNNICYGKYNPCPAVNHKSSGSYSRFFSIDAWWDKYLSKLPDNVRNTFPFLIVPKASKSERNKGCENLEREVGHNRFDRCANCGGYILQNKNRPSACKCDIPKRENNKVKGNSHPTVKPVKLISYLITLGSRKGDVILDPFCGSGTTGVSCQITGRKFIGIELDEYNCKISKCRIEAESPLFEIRK